MAVYVDEARTPYRPPHNRHQTLRMSHMIADTTEELLAMADLIGVQQRWIQFPGTYKEHFDIAHTKRALAIKNGAVAVTTRELGVILRAKRTAAFPHLHLGANSKEIP